MATDIGPGDLVVCVDNSPDCRANARPKSQWHPKRGGIYRCIWLGMTTAGVTGLRLAEQHDKTGAYAADRFRPLNDEADNAELIARIKDCRPTPAKERVDG